jgi:hypothetical protein
MANEEALAIFNSPHLFGLYSIGLAGGFLAYLIVFSALNGKAETAKRMGDDRHPLNLE